MIKPSLTIKAKFQLNTLLSLLLVCGIGVGLYLTSQQLRSSIQKSLFVDQVSQSVFELDLLANDYLLHQERRSHRQWLITHDLLTQLLRDPRDFSTSERRLITQIAQSHQKLKTVFSSVVSTFVVHKVGEVTPSQYSAMQERLISRLMAISQLMLDNIRQLSNSSKSAVISIEQQTRVVVLLLIGFLALIMITNLYFLKRGIIEPLDELQKGIKALGDGDLTHRMALNRQDEIGDVAKSFDLMSGNLQKVTVSKDVLEKEIAQRALVTSQLHLTQEIMDYMNEGVYLVTTVDGILRYTNPALARVFGYEQGQLAGRHVSILNAPGELGAANISQKMVEEFNQQGLWRGELESIRADGTVFWSKFSISGFEHHQWGHVWIGLMEDITEHRALQNHILHSSKMEALGTVAGGIAHDFNNILAIIKGNAEMALLNLPDDPKQKKYIDAIAKAGVRAAGLVSQILTFSRMETASLKRVDLAVLIEDAIEMLHAIMPANIQIHQDIDKEGLLIHADTVKIQQILLNVCTNAYHAMEDKDGVVDISLKSSDESFDDSADKSADKSTDKNIGKVLTLKIKDTGHGISPAHQKKIFDPFFTTKSVGKGTGLGLSVVHGIVKEHGGRIEVDSQLGVGTTVSVIFKVLDDFTGQDSEQQDNTLDHIGVIARQTQTGQHILVVEDESEVAQLYQELLETAGFTVTWCDNGVDALAAFKANPQRFDLVLTDHAMPYKTGIELCKELLVMRPELPIVLSTGYADLISEKEALSLGFQAYMMKPVNLAKLQQVIERCLNHV